MKRGGSSREPAGFRGMPSSSESKCIWWPEACGRECAHHSAAVADAAAGNARAATARTREITASIRLRGGVSCERGEEKRSGDSVKSCA